MKVQWEGRTWELDTAEVGLKQAVVITGRMGTTLGEWESLIYKPDDPKWLPAIGCLYWLMLCQDGQTAVLADVDFPVLKYLDALTNAIKAEIDATQQESPAEPDPTMPAEPPAVAVPPDLAPVPLSG